MAFVFSYNCVDIQYPSEETVLNYANELAVRETLNRPKQQDFTKPVHKVITQYMRNDKIYEMHDQDRTDIWSHRYFWLAYFIQENFNINIFLESEL